MTDIADSEGRRVADVATVGTQGVRHDVHGNAILGHRPIIHTGETIEGDPRSVRTTLDMNPTVVDAAQLLAIIIEHNDAGRSVHFLGHIVMAPTDPGTHIKLNDDGSVEVSAE